MGKNTDKEESLLIPGPSPQGEGSASSPPSSPALLPHREKGVLPLPPHPRPFSPTGRRGCFLSPLIPGPSPQGEGGVPSPWGEGQGEGFSPPVNSTSRSTKYVSWKLSPFLM